MRVRTPLVAAIAAGCLATAALGAAGTTAHADPAQDGRTVEHVPDAHGAGRHAEVPATAPAPRAATNSVTSKAVR
ncbi:hypothetical protein [Streptomyces sp. NPDC016845]|uniref:hypothetical protein n=1 Tax=Streptomyces sp. NPDC016845 TaxID=3364972 RepID=UPI00379A0086